MNKVHGYSPLVLSPAAVWVLTVLPDAQAQEEGQEKNKSETDEKKSEQMIDREKGGKDKSSETYGEQAVTGGSNAEQVRKIKYKPRGMTDGDLMEWPDGNPPGWSRGNKTGWGGAGSPPGQMKKQGEQEIVLIYPRGSENWDARRKQEWQSQPEQSRARILERIRLRGGMSTEDEESAIFSIDGQHGKGYRCRTSNQLWTERLPEECAAGISKQRPGPCPTAPTRAPITADSIN